MSFGLRDEDWVDPPEQEPIKCHDCDEWFECDCGCFYGWCKSGKCFTHGDDEC